MLISGWKTTRTLISKSTHNFSLLWSTPFAFDKGKAQSQFKTAA
jgi:hypothetical protein